MGDDLKTHFRFMSMAMEEAQKAEAYGEVPVGAVVVDESGLIVAGAFNQTIRLCDPTAHAEILALRAACRRLGNYRLTGARLYSTIEPCIMCMGAIINARVGQVCFGASDPRWGAAGSIYDFPDDPRLNHSPRIVRGILKDECAGLMMRFFKSRR